MPRRPRNATGGLIYHVINRAVGRSKIFRKDEDYLAFEQVLAQAHQRLPMRILAYCLMPNHWHLALYPRRDTDLSEFMRWLTVTHTQRWHAHYKLAGTGPLYQGRFKSLPVQSDSHFLTLCRYIERNPLRAKLVSRAQDWQWSSLYRRTSASPADKALLADWPVQRPPAWTTLINRPQDPTEESALRECIRRGRPWGDPRWQARTAARLDLLHTFRPQGRPPKKLPITP